MSPGIYGRTQANTAAGKDAPAVIMNQTVPQTAQITEADITAMMSFCFRKKNPAANAAGMNQRINPPVGPRRTASPAVPL